MRATRSSPPGRFLLAGVAAILAAAATSASAFGGGGTSGAVYTLTNAAGGNAVAVFSRASDGTLTPAGTVPTGGLGSGGGLGSQNALVLSKNNQRLFAVNAGDNTISAFRVKKTGLEQIGSPVSSGGVNPISLTEHENLLYVLNTGDGGSPGNISGFRVENDGLDPIVGSTRPLSGAAVGPAQVQFSPNGKVLVVTEKGTNLIDTYLVGAHGFATGPNSQASAAATPFGFTFDRQGVLLVTDAFGGSPGASGLSSYDLSGTGALSAITPFLGDTQTAACWVVATRDGRFAYTTNTGSASISTYRIDTDGSLSLRNPIGATTGSSPTDAGLSKDSHYLYALVSGAINAFRIADDGGLTAITGATGLPAGDVGLAAN